MRLYVGAGSGNESTWRKHVMKSILWLSSTVYLFTAEREKTMRQARKEPCDEDLGSIRLIDVIIVRQCRT